MAAGTSSYDPPSIASPGILDRRGSRAASDMLPVLEQLPVSTQPGGHLMSFSCPATPDTSTHDPLASECDKSPSKRQTRSTTHSPMQQGLSPVPMYRSFPSRTQAQSSGASAELQHRPDTDSEDELRPGSALSHGGGGPCMGRQASFTAGAMPEFSPGLGAHDGQLNYDHSPSCKRCRHLFSGSALPPCRKACGRAIDCSLQRHLCILGRLHQVLSGLMS